MRKIHIDEIGKTVEVDDGLSDKQIDQLVHNEIIPAYRPKAASTPTSPADTSPTIAEGNSVENMGRVAGEIADVPRGISASFGLDPDNPPEWVKHPVDAIGKGISLLKRKGSEYTTSPAFLEQDIKDAASGVLDYADKKSKLVRSGQYRHLIPFVGEALDETQHEFENERYGRGIGRTIGMGAQVASASPEARATATNVASEAGTAVGKMVKSGVSKTAAALEPTAAKTLRIAADVMSPRYAVRKYERKLAQRIEKRHAARESAAEVMDATEGIDEKVAKFEADAKANRATLDSSNEGGSNYTAEDLKKLKEKHGIGQPAGEVTPTESGTPAAAKLKYKPNSKHFIRNGNIVRDYEVDAQGNPKLTMEKRVDTGEPLPFTEGETVPQSLGAAAKDDRRLKRSRAEIVDDQAVLDTMRNDLSTQSNRAITESFREAGEVGGHPAREGLAEGVTGKPAGFGSKKLKKKGKQESTSAEGPKRPGTGPGAMLARGSKLLRMNEGPQTGDTTRTAFDMLKRSGPFARGEVHVALNNPEMFAPVDRAQYTKTRLPLDSTRWVRTQDWIHSNKQVREVMEHGAVEGKGAHGDWNDTPVYVVKRGDQHFILNGHHRITAAIKRGDPDIEVELIDISGPKEQGYRNLAKDMLRERYKTHRFEMKKSSSKD